MNEIIYELTAPRTLATKRKPLDTAAPGALEVIAVTEFSLVSTGTELAAWLGKPPLRPSSPYPRLMGYCNVARVLEVGSAVTDISPGDYVLTHEAHRSHVRCHRKDVLLAAADLSVETRHKLVTTYLYHLGYVALVNGGYVPGYEVAVVGLGTLGLTTASLVLAFGGDPVIFTGRPGEPRPSFLANASVHPKSAPASGWRAAGPDLNGADLVVNTSDDWQDYLLCLRLARKGGTIVLLGFPGRGSPAPDFNPLDSQYLYDKQLTVRQVGHVAQFEAAPIDCRFTLQRNLHYLFTLLRKGLLDPSPLLTTTASWRELAKVYEDLSARRSGMYSALIDWTC